MEQTTNTRVDTQAKQPKENMPKSQEDVTKAQEDMPKASPKAQAGMLMYAIIFMLVCVAPFAGLLFAPPQTSLDQDTLAAAPQATQEDGSLNLSFLSDAGSYFEDHFAFRTTAIDLNSRLRAGVFGTSPTNQVIVGSEGWLYYGGTLNDYSGTQPLSNREIFNITHNLELMQGYAQAQGAMFVFTIAPNKNTLYPNHMPYYVTQGTDDSMQRLAQALENNDINYVDLFALFEQQDEELYYKTDTHWTNEGALLVSNALLEAAGVKEVQAGGSPEEGAVTGDIELMLYPVTAQEEPAMMLQTGPWSFAVAEASVEDSRVDTQGQGSASLIMFRDSFANTLIPLMSPQFGQAQYSKLIPYDLQQIAEEKPSVVIVERAQRHVRLLTEDAPFLLAPSLTLEAKGEQQTNSSIEWYTDGSYQVVEGWVDETVVTEDSQIFIEVTASSGKTKVYAPFYTCTPTTQYGFKLYLDEQSIAQERYTFRVLILNDEAPHAQSVFAQTLQR